VSIGPIAIGVALHTLWWRVRFEVLVVLADALQEIQAQLFAFFDLLRLRTGDVKIHGFVGLLAGGMLHEARTAAFDLNTAAAFLLNMLDVGSSLAYNLGTEVEARNIFHVERDTLFGPFAPSEFIALNGVLVSSAEAALVDQIG